MLKEKAKRRRTKAEKAEEEKSGFGDAHILNEKLKRLKTLEDELKESKVKAASNEAASHILNQMIDQGKAKLHDDGSVSLIENDGINQGQIQS